MKKKLFLSLLSMIILSFFCLAEGEFRHPFIASKDFSAGIGFTVRPSEMKEQVRTNPQSGILQMTQPREKNVTIYNFYALPASAPGVLELRMRYRTILRDKAGKAELTINLYDSSKRNGSAGKQAFAIPLSSGWNEKTFSVEVPAHARGIQYILSFPGAENVLELAAFSIQYSPDTLISPSMKNFQWEQTPLSSSFWTPMNHFYTLGMAVREQTTAYFAADEKGFYFAFENCTATPENLVCRVKERDGRGWNDDCDELFLFDEKRQTGWQFGVTAGNTVFDGKLFMKVPGDPWRMDLSWNGRWNAMAHRTSYGWESRFFLPWKTLEISPDAKDFQICINPVRENKQINENSMWNCYVGRFQEVGKYAQLVRKNGQYVLTRYRNRETPSYTVNRKPADWSSYLAKGSNRLCKVSLWDTGYLRPHFPEAISKRCSNTDFALWQKELRRAWYEAGIMAPTLPWCLENSDRAELKRQLDEAGMKMPYYFGNSSIDSLARRMGAVYVGSDPKDRVNPVDPAFHRAVLKTLEDLPGKPIFPDLKKYTGLLMGIDEPTNSIRSSFDRNRNKNHAAALDRLDAELKEKYGFGLPDFSGVYTPENQLRLIAFYRWWNERLATHAAEWTKAVEKVFPGVPFKGVNDNTTAGRSALDVSLLNGVSPLIGCDPYPTSTSALFGNARARYHTGYSVRVIHDLAPDSKVICMPQAFVYHGGIPQAGDMNEWASQALKNGAGWIMWYTSGAVYSMFDGYVAMLNISGNISAQPKICLPEDSRSAILYSFGDVWGRGDSITCAAYTVYSILGETLRSGFRFIADTAIGRGEANLSKYKVIYVPSLRFTGKETAERLLNFVKNGGRLVIFDPDFLLCGYDGRPLPEREKLLGFGSPLQPHKMDFPELTWKDTTLPVSPVMHRPSFTGDRFECFKLPPTASNARIIAWYSDKTPAAVERKIGQGSVLFFAVQPFGSASFALAPGGWEKFFASEISLAQEKSGLAFWAFQLPVPGNRIQLKQILK